MKINLPENWREVAGLTEAKETKISCHVAKKVSGQLGTIIVLEGDDCDDIAKILGISAKWELKDLHHGWAAYDGNRLTLFQHKGDFEKEDIK